MSWTSRQQAGIPTFLERRIGRFFRHAIDNEVRMDAEKWYANCISRRAPASAFFRRVPSRTLADAQDVGRLGVAKKGRLPPLRPSGLADFHRL
jgi:hypothetical protein